MGSDNGHHHWDYHKQAKRDARRAAREDMREKLALQGRWSKFLPHPSEAKTAVLIDGTSISEELGGGRHGQMAVMDHIYKSIEITQLDFKVIFEGRSGKWAKKARTAGVDVVFTCDRPSCDVLLELADEKSLVVTVDRTVAKALLDSGAGVMKARRFYVLTDTDSEDSSSSSSSSSSESSESEESEDESEDERHHRGRKGRQHRRDHSSESESESDVEEPPR